MFCGKCGGENGEGAEFCTHCGNVLALDTIAPVQGIAVSPQFREFLENEFQLGPKEEVQCVRNPAPPWITPELCLRIGGRLLCFLAAFISTLPILMYLDFEFDCVTEELLIMMLCTFICIAFYHVVEVFCVGQLKKKQLLVITSVRVIGYAKANHKLIFQPIDKFSIPLVEMNLTFTKKRGQQRFELQGYRSIHTFYEMKGIPEILELLQRGKLRNHGG